MLPINAPRRVCPINRIIYWSNPSGCTPRDILHRGITYVICAYVISSKSFIGHQYNHLKNTKQRSPPGVCVGAKGNLTNPCGNFYRQNRFVSVRIDWLPKDVTPRNHALAHKYQIRGPHYIRTCERYSRYSPVVSVSAF